MKYTERNWWERWGETLALVILAILIAICAGNAFRYIRWGWGTTWVRHLVLAWCTFAVILIGSVRRTAKRVESKGM